jgi:hypothetical protein
MSVVTSSDVPAPIAGFPAFHESDRHAKGAAPELFSQVVKITGRKPAGGSADRAQVIS